MDHVDRTLKKLVRDVPIIIRQRGVKFAHVIWNAVMLPVPIVKSSPMQWTAEGTTTSWRSYLGWFL